MKFFHLPLAIALASLGLVACDYRDETTATASPQASLPDDTVLNAPATTGAAGPVTQPTDPVDATPAPVQPLESAEAPALPPAAADAGTAAPAPDTSAMGAQPGTPAPLGEPPAFGAAMPEAPVAAGSDGVAAPTELARFLEESAGTAAAKAADRPADKPAANAGDGKAGKAKTS